MIKTLTFDFDGEEDVNVQEEVPVIDETPPVIIDFEEDCNKLHFSINRYPGIYTAVARYATKDDFPIPGSERYVYLAEDTNTIYSWDAATQQYKNIVARDTDYKGVDGEEVKVTIDLDTNSIAAEVKKLNANKLYQSLGDVLILDCGSANEMLEGLNNG